jgi:hypothetical protein
MRSFAVALTGLFLMACERSKLKPHGYRPLSSRRRTISGEKS